MRPGGDSQTRGVRHCWASAVGSTLLVFASFSGGLTLIFLVLEQRPTGVWLFVDIGIGALACLALAARDRAPVLVAIALAAAAAGFATAGVANYVALFTVARHRRTEVAFAVALVDVGAALVFWSLYPANASVSLTVVVNVAIALAVVAWGALQQTQQDLVAVYRDRALRIEREHELRAEQIQMAERERIARDMHDSVAHYVSLIALYGGGLEVAGAKDSETVSDTGRTIRHTATRALDELRTAIGILRDGANSGPSEGGSSINDLINAARKAGQLVVAHVDDRIDRSEYAVTQEIYRIVQEGLTNARKHAPGSLVTVDVQRRDDEVLVTITNPVDADDVRAPGNRIGLNGLVERAAATGGIVEHGESRPGEFRLHGRLPCR